jgi:endonuclease YncB( thermonuclease family)
MNCPLLVSAMLATVILTLPAFAAESVTGKARIVDGDTVEVAGTRFRLKGIDAPERGQMCQDILQQPFDCGATAVRTLVDLTKGQKVTCESVRQDRFGRTIGICRLPSGLELNTEMVRKGQAVVFGRSLRRYRAAEDEARLAHAGLWAGSFEDPACWRAQRRGQECRERRLPN